MFYREVLLGWQEALCLLFPQQFGNEDRIHLAIPELGGLAESLVATQESCERP